MIGARGSAIPAGRGIAGARPEDRADRPPNANRGERGFQD